MTDRTTLFLKFALKNRFLDQTQADQILAAIEQRRELGIEKDAAEVAREREFLNEEQIATLTRAVDSIVPPKQVGGFEILAEIGRGTVGTVYRARQVSLDKEVALKLLNPSFQSNPEMVEQFKREAKSAAKINHPHVVTAIDAGEDSGRAYLAMEYVAGETLKDRVERDGPLSESELLDLGRAVAQGLAHAHSHGLLHRDLKPDNLLLGNDGSIKIADFGLAMPMDDAEIMSAEHKRRGTPYYLSPEQARGQSVDEASEIYALGATLYFVATGKPLFTGTSVKEILGKQIQEAPVAPRAAGARISEETEQLILDMLAKEPSARPGSCRDVIDRIDQAERAAAAAPARPAARAARPEVSAARTPASGRPAVQARPTASNPTASKPVVSKPGVASRSSQSGNSSSARPSAPTSKTAGSALESARVGGRNNVFTLVGLGVGVVIALIFVILGVTRNEPEDEQEIVVEQEKKSDEEIQKLVDARIETWKNKREKRNREIVAGVPKIDLQYNETNTRIQALWVMLREPETASAEKAHVIVERIDELEQMARADRTGGLESDMAKVDELRSQDRLMDAIWQLGKMQSQYVKDKEATQRINALIQELSDVIDSRYKEDANALAKALSPESQDYIAAIRILEKIQVYGDVDMQREAASQLEQVKADQATFMRKEAERRAKEEKQQYVDHMRHCKQLAMERRYLECVSQTVKLEQEVTSEEVQKLIQEDLVAFQMLHQFMKDAQDYILKEKGSDTQLKVKLTNDDIERGTSDGIEMIEGKPAVRLIVEVSSGKATKFLEFERIVDATLFEWVEAYHGPRSEKYLVPLALVFAYRGQIEFARRHLELATNRGIDVQRWEKRVDWLESNL